jgi:hypothetical protein
MVKIANYQMHYDLDLKCPPRPCAKGWSLADGAIGRRRSLCKMGFSGRKLGLCDHEGETGPPASALWPFAFQLP